MKLMAYGCKNYKPFRNEEVMEVRPLTLLFGKNSSGKSAMLRLPMLLLRALSAQTRSPFPLKVADVDFGSSFRDLIHGRHPHGAINFNLKIEFEGEVLDLSIEIQNIAESIPAAGQPREYTVVSRFDLISPCNIHIRWIPDRGTPARYEGEGTIPFRGLLPDTTALREREHWRPVDVWPQRAEAMEERIEHLGPFRMAVARAYKVATPGPLGRDGSGALDRLAARDDLREQVAAWYQEHLDGWRLMLSSGPGIFEVETMRGDAKVNLSDAGQGMQQVLPIVVQQLGHQLYDEGPFLDLIEQPELHLHTAAQAPLGELFLNTAMTGRGQTIVETHSENLLLRIRRLIAEGADPRLIALYWVDDHPEGYSTLRRIHIDERGELDWWRAGVFSEGYEEIRAMRKAARRQGNDRTGTG